MDIAGFEDVAREVGEAARLFINEEKSDATKRPKYSFMLVSPGTTAGTGNASQ